MRGAIQPKPTASNGHVVNRPSIILALAPIVLPTPPVMASSSSSRKTAMSSLPCGGSFSRAISSLGQSFEAWSAPWGGPAGRINAANSCHGTTRDRPRSQARSSAGGRYGIISQGAVSGRLILSKICTAICSSVSGLCSRCLRKLRSAPPIAQASRASASDYCGSLRQTRCCRSNRPSQHQIKH